MAKKVTIEGSNLLQNLNDDWGGVNNTQSAKTIYGTSVPAGNEWGVNRGEVERFIKSVLTAHENKIGYFRWSDVVDANNCYHLWGFASEQDATLYISNKTTYAAKLLVDETLPIPNTDVLEANTDNALANIGYYVCDTSASTSAKTVSATGYSLMNGGNIRIKMTYANTADNATLNINNVGAKALYYKGVQASSTNSWEANEVLVVYYDGTQYQACNAQGGGGLDSEDVFGKSQYYDDTTYVMTGTNADNTANWIDFPIVSGHTYRIYLKSDDNYASSARQIYMSTIGIIGTPSVAEIKAGKTYEKTVDKTGNSGLHFNTGVGIEGVSLYIKVEDLTDATTMTQHVIVEPSVLLPADIVNNLTDGGTNKVLSAEMGKQMWNIFGEYQYYNDTTYVMTGTNADNTANWIDFPIVSGHTYRIYLKSDDNYASSARQIYMSTIGIIGTPSVAEIKAGKTYEKTVDKTGNSGLHFNTGVGIEGVSLYIKVEDLTDATTLTQHVITPPSVLTPSDVVNNLTDGGTGKVLSAEMGKHIEQKLHPTKDLDLKPLANCYWGNDLIPRYTTNATHVTTKDLIMLPKQGLTIHYKLPTDIYIRVGFTKRSNPHTSITWLGWITGEGTFDVPEDRVFYRASFGRGSRQNQNISVSEVEQYIENREIVFDYEYNPYEDMWDIIKRNEHNRYIISSIIKSGSSSGLNQFPTFVHSSDIHSDRVRLRSFMKFADYIKADAALVTGDMVWGNASMGAAFLGIVADEYDTPMLICNGNHDSYSFENNEWYNWRNDTYRYNNLFAHLATKYSYKLDENTVSTKCYYYYDIASVNIRVIGIDLYEDGDRGTDTCYFSPTQQQWLKDTMIATPDDYGIIILEHEMVGDPTRITGAEEFWVRIGNNNAPNALKEIVDDFIGRTGDFVGISTTAEFIMYCNGHNHWDMIGYVTGVTHKQLCCNIDLNNAYYAGSTFSANRFPRVLGDQSEDLFNVYAIDRTNKQVRIARVGANMTGDLLPVEHCIVSYAD